MNRAAPGRRALLHRLLRYRFSLGVYLLIGGASALAEWTLFYLLLRAGALGYVAAALYGFALATLLNYLLSRRYGFLTLGGARALELAKTYLVSAAALGVNLGVLVLLVEQAGFAPLPAKVLGTGCGFLLNYCGRQFWVFRAEPRYRASD